MSTLIFNLRPGDEFITLDTLLKLMQTVSSGGEAHAVIADGLVQVNGRTELQKRKKMRDGDYAEFDGQRIEVRN